MNTCSTEHGRLIFFQCVKDVYLLKGIVLPTLIINLIFSNLCRQGLGTEYIRLNILTIVIRNLKLNVHIETNHAASRGEVHTQILISKVYVCVFRWDIQIIARYDYLYF